MNSNHRIIQWNCRGLRSNYNEILLLLSLLSPSVFCLQETFLKTDDQFNIRDFNTYNYIYSEGQRPSGGSSILVHSSCPQREIKLVTNLQAVAVSVTLDKEITICSVYIPPNFHLETEHLDTLLNRHSGLVVERPLCDREVAGSIPGRVIPKTLKMVLAALSLGAQH